MAVRDIGGPRRPTSDYREYRPAPALEPYLACTWSQAISHSDADFLQRVLPDGCADVVWIGDAAPRVVGLATRAVGERLAPGTRVVGARFRPGAAAAVLDVPAVELRDAQLGLDTLWGRDVGSLSERVAAARTVAGKLAVVEAGLLARVAKAPRPDALVLAVARAVEQDLRSPVEALLRASGLSARHLRRRFQTAVGYGPKMFQRIARLRRLREVAVSRRPGPTALAALAYDLGYADQAHLTREITALAGISPRRFMAHAPWIQAVSDPFTAAR